MKAPARGGLHAFNREGKLLRPPLENPSGLDNGTPEILTRWRSSATISTSIVREDRKGLARARNAGIEAAAGKWIVFTDDDCRMREDYLRNFCARARRQQGEVLLGGRVLLGDPRDMRYSILDLPHARVYDRAICRKGTHLGGWIIGANMACPRSLFSRIGLFDTRFGAGASFKAAEDTDLLIRCFMNAIAIEYVPDLVVSHHHGRRTVADIRRLLAGYGEGEGALYAKYLIRCPLYLRQIYWDSRNAVREWFGGPLFVPELGLGHTEKLCSNIRGFVRYWLGRAGSDRGA